MDVAEKTADPAWIYSVLSALIGEQFDHTNFGSVEDELRAASPVTYITKSSPPTIVAHGQKDDVVPYAQGLDVCNAFETAGGICELIPFPNSGHGLDNDPDATQRYNELFRDYQRRYFGY
jgi:dipeptidyl aminopeptidase/acylaminoacyl peptidase